MAVECKSATLSRERRACQLAATCFGVIFFGSPATDVFFVFAAPSKLLSAWPLAVAMLPSLGYAMVIGKPFSPTLFGISVRSASGRPASRLRVVLRCLLFWGLVGLPAAVVTWLIQGGQYWVAASVGALLLIVLIVVLVAAIKTPRSGLLDAMAGTHLTLR